MALILQIETATATCSAALSDKGSTIAVKELHGQNIHASHLTLFIQEVMDTAGKRFEDLHAVAVSRGPGSYTGLRIGVSTAKGLCFGLGVPLIAVDTMNAMSAALLKQSNFSDTTLLCPMIDARRMEVYMSLMDLRMRQLLPVQALIVQENAFDDYLKDGQIAFFGDGAEKCQTLIRHPNAIFIHDFYNSAAGMSAIAYQAYAGNTTEDLAAFEPFYLKEFLFAAGKSR